MGASLVPVLFFTLLWGAVGAILPFFIPANPHKSVIQVSLLLTGVSCWLFWLCCYMAQMNPLVGPQLTQKALYAIYTEWDNWLIQINIPKLFTCCCFRQNILLNFFNSGIFFLLWLIHNCWTKWLIFVNLANTFHHFHFWNKNRKGLVSINFEELNIFFINFFKAT